MANTTQIIAQELTGAGATPAGAAGVIGNWQQESGLNPASNGGLLGQWQGPRYAALQSFAQSRGRAVTDPAVQAQFAVNEMKTQYGGLWHMLTTTNNPRAAAIAVSQQYERPGIPMLGNRIRYATQAFQQLGGGSAASIARQMSQPTPTVTNTAPTSTTDYGDALAQSLLSESASPVDTSGRVRVPNILGSAINNAQTTSTPAQTTVTQGSTPNLSQGADRVKVTPGKGDINPLGSGWTLGRTDQGVDANAKVGTPIRALNDSRVVDIQHNWYAGQPLVLMQITSGPNTGKYWYVAEQIQQNLRVGQLLPKGTVVATYAPAGTGIEIGWGHPGGGDTLAQAQGNTGGPGHSNAPAGINFRQTELR